MRQHNLHFYLKLTVAVIVAFAAVAASCCLGSSNVTINEVLKYLTGNKDELSKTALIIIGKIRFPRAFTSAIVGGSLAVIGSVMQGLFKNPMADPSVLGISSGSALGASVAITLGVSGPIIGGSITGSYVGAVVGALVTWLIVFSIARMGGEFDTASTLLAGIAISSVTSGFITLIMTHQKENMEKIYMWMLGSFTFSTNDRLMVLFIVSLVLNVVIFVFAPRIDVLKLGKETAASLGVNMNITLGILMTASSLMLAVCVANSGIIGFVGLVIPHVVSFFKVNKARQKAILCFFTGAAFMTICDIVAKTILNPGEIAVGAITDIIGGPYFLYLLIKNRRART